MTPPMTPPTISRARSLALCALTLLAAAAAGERTATAADRPPNVVMIISDDQGWTDYGFMGHAVVRTPRLDRLARQSLLFTRGYVPASLCRPSLASLATGLYPHQHRITSNDPPRGPRAEMLRQRRRMIDIFRRSPTLAGLLAARGYISHQSGKWWEGSYREGGFTHGMTHGDPKRGGRHGDAGLEIGRTSMKPILDFLDAAGGRPFFIWYAPFLPHMPHNPPARLLEKYTAPGRPAALARYYAMCEWFDETCGTLLDALESRGLATNTLVVYIADNGWLQRTPDTVLPTGWRVPNAPKSKRSPYDLGIRTPIMLRWPGHIAPRRDDGTLVESVDLVPTILRVCGVEPPAAMPGVNLLDGTALRAREAIFGEIFTHNAVDIEHPESSVMYRWCIEGHWKLILPDWRNVPDRQPELYDLAADPSETRDLVTAQPLVAARLRRRIAAWWEPRAPRAAGKPKQGPRSRR